jgi:hypothetical protein
MAIHDVKTRPTEQTGELSESMDCAEPMRAFRILARMFCLAYATPKRED